MSGPYARKAGWPGRGALERKNGSAEQKLCADPVGSRARNSHAGHPAAPAAAGGRPDALDEMAEPGRVSTLMLHSGLQTFIYRAVSGYHSQNNVLSQLLQL